MKRLAGQWALVTGASSGIGREIARRLAEEGANLLLVARRGERLEALAVELREAQGVEVQVEICDLAAPGAAAELHGRVRASERSVDLLINNAGFGDYRSFLETGGDRLWAMIQLNVTALTELTRLFLPAMVERRGGRVMNVASIAAWTPMPGYVVYAATKAYVRNFTEALDAELVRGGSGVRAIAVCPGGTTTEFLGQANLQVRGRGQPFMMSARRCADIAVDRMLAGRRLVITGFANTLGMWCLRLIPRSWLPRLSRWFLELAAQRTEP